MSVFNYHISEFLFSFQNNCLRGIQVKITSNMKDFGNRSSKPYVRVLDAADLNNLVFKKSEIEKESVQKNAIFAYTNAFARRCLYDQKFWLPYFNGESIPESVETEKIFHQFEPEQADQLLIAYPSDPDRATSLVVAENYNGTPANISNGDLRLLDGVVVNTLQNEGSSPSHTNGILLRWEADKELELSFANQNTSAYSHLSFRIANGSRGSILEGMRIGLSSGADIRYITIDSIDPPDVRSDVDGTNNSPPFDGAGYGLPGVQLYARIIRNRDPTKYPIRTIRIPLTEFVNQGINQAALNRVLFKFPNVAGGGKVTIDNVLFVK